MTSEILSIIAVCISGLTALFSAIVPAILSYKAKKAELQSQKTREAQQRYEAEFEVFYQKHLRIINDFSYLYEHWKNEPSNKAEILEFINETAAEFRYPISQRLLSLAKKIEEYQPDDNIDDEYKRCRQIILDSYGARISGSTPDYLLSEILKVVLKERFNELLNSTSKDFHFHRR